MAARLPQKQTWDMAQTTWANAINPVLASPIVQGLLIKDVELINGVTVVNHKLSRKLVGWLIVGINAAATVYDNQANNQTPQLTLSLTSNATATCSLWVF